MSKSVWGLDSDSWGPSADPTLAFHPPMFSAGHYFILYSVQNPPNPLIFSNHGNCLALGFWGVSPAEPKPLSIVSNKYLTSFAFWAKVSVADTTVCIYMFMAWLPASTSEGHNAHGFGDSVLYKSW